MNSAEILVTFKGDTKDLDKKTSNAKNALSGFGKFLGGTFGTAMGIATTAIVGVGTALANLTKQSVEAYSEFEQLEGGIDALFGTGGKNMQEYAEETGKSIEEIEEEWTNLDTAYHDVLDNADQAYKTAGISANQYLETVTSFSASLISGLGGDTIEAARVADIAMQDMGDNANRFGTSMENIQTVYMNLAKQQYMTLDNLKLGYGGSASEMARLVNESGVLNGEMEVTAETVKNVPFDKLIAAIHVTQERLHVTGTTAKEAGTTIQGSMKMAKASWENFVAGLSKKDADIGTLIDEFISSAITFADNIVPVVIRAVEGIANALPLIATKIGDMLPDLMGKLLPPLVEAVINLTQSLVQNLPQIIHILFQAIIQISIAATKMLPEIFNAILVATLMIIDELAKALPDLLPIIVEAIMGIIPVLIENTPLFIKVGLQLLLGLIEGILTSIPQLVISMWDVIKSIFNVLKTLPERAISLGKDLLAGLWNGIANKTEWVVNKIKGLGTKVLNAAKKIFGIGSPSKEFAKIGEWNIIGLENGMEDMQPELQRTLNSMFDLQPNISGAMSNTLSPNLNVVVNNNMEVDPIGQVVNKIKTFSGGAKNDYNWGATQ